MRNYLREMLFGPSSGPQEPVGDLEQAQESLGAPAHQVTWEIREIGPDDDHFEVWRGRRFYSVYDSMLRASAHIDVAMTTGDLVFHVHPDGYRERLIGKRRRWRG